MKRMICLIMVTVLGFLIVQPVCANSMPDIWYGEKGNMAFPMDDDCPIEVKKEILTFDVQEFPQTEYQTEQEFREYDGKVTAEYTFYNPTDEKITARLAFPLGGYSYLAMNPETYEYWDDTEKYDITVDNEMVEKELRYTFQGYFDFRLSVDKEKLNDEYVKELFYYPEQTVTKYTYEIQSSEVEWDNLDARAVMEFDVDKTKLFTTGTQCAWDNEDGSYDMSVFDTYGDEEKSEKKTIFIYLIGEDLNQGMKWKFSDMEKEVGVEGKAVFVKKETMTLEDLVFLEYEKDSGISKTDWYNSYIDFMKDGEWDTGVTGWEEYSYETGLEALLMRWYEYEITLEPGETIVNTVTAPIYPTIDLDSRNADFYEYTYLLSPAKLWGDFGTLEIRINTPNYIVSDNKGEFEKTDTGYVLKREGLPDEEFIFELSETENAKRSRGFYMDINDLAIIVHYLLLILIIVMPIVFFWRWRRKKGKKNVQD